MKVNGFVARSLHGLRVTAASVAVLQMSIGPALAAVPAPAFGGVWKPGADRSGQTATPIKHVIVIIGENRSFDHVFATYVPHRGQTVPQPAERGHHPAGCQQERHPGTELPQGPAASGYRPGRPGHVPVEPAEAAISQQPAAAAPGRRPFGNERLLHAELSDGDDGFPAAPPPSMAKPPPTSSLRRPARP